MPCFLLELVLCAFVSDAIPGLCKRAEKADKIIKYYILKI